MHQDPRRNPQPQCPICQTATLEAWRPFCSKRCADIDLGRWMTGHYAIPVQEEDAPDPEIGD